MYGHTDLKKDTLIELDGVPYRVIDYSHAAMGRGGAVARVKLKNLLSGGVTERTFRASDRITPAALERRAVQLLYRDGLELVFMDQASYEQETLSPDLIGEASKYLSDGAVVQLLSFQKRVIGAEIPNNLYLEVTDTQAGARGNTATTALKPATIETGIEVMVPLFINVGDVIKVDTRTGSYLERQK